MVVDWTISPFRLMASLARDSVHPKDAPGLPYIGLEHIGEGTLQLVGTEVAEDATSLKSRFRTGDILFGKLRPYFRKVIKAPFDGMCSTDIWVVRPKPGVDAGFLFYLMASDLFMEPVVRASEGTKMPRARWEYAETLTLPLPPLPDQQAIAHILGMLDDKIELNRKMNQTLEAMARAIFKSWFVDFDPVRAKAEGRWPRGASLPGLPADMWDRFPSEFQESELGPVPKGWRIATIGDACLFAYGKALKEELRQPGIVPVFGSNGQVGWHDAALVRGPGIIVGRKGNPGVVTWSQDDFFPIDTTFYVIAKSVASVPYLLFTLKDAYLGRLESDSAVPGLNRDAAQSVLSLIPPAEVVAGFDEAAEHLLELVALSDKQSRTLAAIRDTLLPKLISGEIRVPDAEKIASAAT